MNHDDLKYFPCLSYYRKTHLLRTHGWVVHTWHIVPHGFYLRLTYRSHWLCFPGTPSSPVVLWRWLLLCMSVDVDRMHTLTHQIEGRLFQESIIVIIIAAAPPQMCILLNGLSMIEWLLVFMSVLSWRRKNTDMLLILVRATLIRCGARCESNNGAQRRPNNFGGGGPFSPDFIYSVEERGKWHPGIHTLLLQNFQERWKLSIQKKHRHIECKLTKKK